MTFTGIAINGKSKAGKDELGQALLQVSPSLRRIGLADAPKAFLGQLTGLDFLRTDVKDEHREMLVQFSELPKPIRPNVWVDYTFDAIKSWPDGLRPIITDLRFPVEAEACRRAGFLLVRLECSDEERRRRGARNVGSTHVSECGLDDWQGFHVRVRSDELTPLEIRRIVLQSFHGLRQIEVAA